MKKDIFNFNRFGKYFVSDIKTCIANYGLSLATISLLSLLLVYVCHVGFCLLINNEWYGAGLATRGITFAVIMFCIVVTMPVKCYGQLTEKRYGSQWLMVPASKLEKFLSMIIMSCVIVPVVGSTLFLGLDALICVIDPTCGDSLIRTLIQLPNVVNGLVENGLEMIDNENIIRLINQAQSPWLYVDDSIQMSLPFILGAIYFKNGKTVKTFLALAVFGTLVSVITTPIMIDWTKSIADTAASQNFADMFLDHWVFRNMVLVDTISDTVNNVALLVAIYFRIKTLKH